METKNTPPITLEEAAENIDHLLDIATDTRDLQYGSHFVLHNLIRHLNSLGIINGREFILSTRAQTFAIPELYYRLGVEVVCDQLLEALPLSAAESGDAVH